MIIVELQIYSEDQTPINDGDEDFQNMVLQFDNLQQAWDAYHKMVQAAPEDQE